MVILYFLKGEVCEYVSCDSFDFAQRDHVIVASMVYPNRDRYLLLELIDFSHQVYGRGQQNQLLHSGLIFHSKDRTHQPPKTGTHKSYPCFAGKDIPQFFHALRETTTEMGGDHIRVLLFKKDRFSPLVAAFQAVNKDFERHKMFGFRALNHVPEPISAGLCEKAILAYSGFPYRKLLPVRKADESQPKVGIHHHTPHPPL